MIKLFDNKTNSPKIEVESKFLINKSTVKTDSEISNITKNDLLFVKLTFSGLESNQKINSLFLNLTYRNVYSNTPVKVVKCNDYDISDENIINIAQTMTGSEEIVEKMIIYQEGHSLAKINGLPYKSYSLDITNAAKEVTSTNSRIMIAISFPNGAVEDFTLSSPESIAENSVCCQASMSEICGLSGLYQYDAHDLGRCGTVNINLSNGKPIYSLNLLSSISKKIPITFSIFQNENNEDNVTHFDNRVIPNFHYKFYQYDNNYVLEDPTGFKNYYEEVEYTEDNKTEVLNKLGVKYETHIDNGATLYISHFDYSYIYVLEGEDTVVHLYDKANNHTYFLVDDESAKIQSFDNYLGYSLTYTWSNNKLEKIINSDGEEMLVDYNSAEHIVKLSLPAIERYVDFVENDANETLNIRTYCYNITSTTKKVEETLSEVILYFNSNKLIKVLDIDTEYYALIERNNNKVTKVEIWNEDKTEKKYSSKYNYGTRYAKITDSNNNSLHYHFNNYGRVKTIMDDNARTITYNYDEFENGESKNLIGLSKLQNNARNLIENHSFENENVFEEDSISWKKLCSEDAIVEIVYDGLLSEKCLKVSTNSTDKVSIYQNIINPQSGYYVLRGFIKHSDTVGLNSSNIKVRVKGTYKLENNDNNVIPFENEANLDFDNQIWYQFETNRLRIPANAYDVDMTVELVVEGKITTVYLDDLQLTNSESFTRYNLVENGYMEFVDSNNRPEGWSFVNFDEEDVVVEADRNNLHSVLLGEKVMKIASGDDSVTSITNANYKVKKMFKTIPINGLAGDQLVFSVFGKGCVTENTIFRAFIQFNYEKKQNVYSKFDFDKHYDNWQVLTRSVVAEDNYNEVVIGIEYDGGVEVLLDCFQLYKDSFGKYYNYDFKGNITEVVDGYGSLLKISYDNKNKINEIYSNDGTYFRYYYDDNDRLSSVKDLNGNRVQLTYDDEDRIISTQLITKDGEIISNSTIYDDLKNTETVTNEYGNVFKKSMDYLNRVISYTDANGLETTFSYNGKSQLEKMNAIVNIVTNNNTYTYDNQGNMKTVRSANGSLYDLTYDTFGRLESIKCNGNCVEQYQYDNLKNGYKKGLLLKKILGSNGDYYEFKYNDSGQVILVKLNGDDLASYTYDENGNVYELTDVKNNIYHYFTYDLQGQLLKMKTTEGDSISYTYDNLGNVQKVTYNINQLIRSIDYEYEYELNEYTREGYFNRLANMFGDEIVVSGNGGDGQFGAKYLLATCSYDQDSEIGMRVFNFTDIYDFMNYRMSTFNVNRNSGVVNGKVFSKENWDGRFAYNKTFYMFVKPTGSYPTDKENLFSFARSEDNSQVAEIMSHLCINNIGELAYIPEGGSSIVSTKGKIKLNEWNLVGIKIYKEECNCCYKVELFLNEETAKAIGIAENVEKINYLFVGRQDSLDVDTSKSASSATSTDVTTKLNMPFKVCLMSFGSYAYDVNDFKAIYKEGLKYLFKVTTPKSNATIYYNEKAYEGFDVITLNGSLESSKGIKPVKMPNIDKSYKLDKTRIFKYDEELKKHIFASYEGINNLSTRVKNSLTYKLPLQEIGTVTLQFKRETGQEDINPIVSFGDNEQIVLSVYFFDNEELKVIINGITVESTNEKYVTDNEWHNLIIRFRNNKLEIFLDQLTDPLYSQNETISLTNKLLYIGNDNSGNYPLNGYIEMLAFKDSFLSDEEINKIFNEGKTIIVRNELDTIGRLSKNKIFVNDNELVTEYTYDKTRVTKQELHNGNNIFYTYDAMNNVTSKKFVVNGVESEVKYEYNKLGRLTKETYPNGKTEEFKYDQNGNIKTRIITESNGTVVEEEYVYDTTIKDKLLEIKNKDTGNTIQNISYDSNDAFKPINMKIKGVYKTLSWEGRRLTDIGNDIHYEYNSQGIRTKKETLNEVTTYKLEGNKIISMNKQTSNENVVLDFVYDASSMLIGLNTIEGNYFYIRDITGNIIGLVDNNGNFVVKYEYDAWGNILINDIKLVNCIAANHNPFVYKGYYYDSETNLFLVSSRYYSPELCRWISPDDIEYLDPESVNGLNLYCYCANDPINHIDPDGHAWYHWAIGAGIIVACAALTVITAGGFAAAGAAFASVVTATMAPTALSAVFAGATIGAAAIGVAGAVIGGKTDENGFSWDNDWSWENSSKGFMIGSIAGAVIGGAWGGAHYALQSAGKMAIRTNINNLVNNPLDEFVTVGPKDGGISSYVRSINATGDYGKIYASKLQNGLYQIANGHHRVAALRQLGYRYVNFFLVP